MWETWNDVFRGTPGFTERSGLERILADKSYRGQMAPADHRLKAFITEQKRTVTAKIKREICRRVAVGPVKGHFKSEHRMGRNYLWHRHRYAVNPILATVEHNFRRLIRGPRPRLLLRRFGLGLSLLPQPNPG